MDISTLASVGSKAINEAAMKASTNKAVPTDSGFASMFQSALNNINETNSLLNRQEEEEIKFALGLTDSTHDLSIAMAKAQTALSFTTTLRDKFLESYKEIMQIQV